MRPTERKGERGTQVAELAIIMPLMFFLVLLVTEGAGLVRTHQILNNAAREGARLSAMPENAGNTDDIKLAVVNYAAQNGVTITSGDVTIEQNVFIPTSSGVSIPASRVIVQHAYPLQYFRMPFFNLPTSLPLAGVAEFRNFY
jgi:Flp pilus assembly protein TadG